MTPAAKGPFLARYATPGVVVTPANSRLDFCAAKPPATSAASHGPDSRVSMPIRPRILLGTDATNPLAQRRSHRVRRFSVERKFTRHSADSIRAEKSTAPLIVAAFDIFASFTCTADDDRRSPNALAVADIDVRANLLLAHHAGQIHGVGFHLIDIPHALLRPADPDLGRTECLANDMVARRLVQKDRLDRLFTGSRAVRSAM